jgi:hypothetical protein
MRKREIHHLVHGGTRERAKLPTPSQYLNIVNREITRLDPHLEICEEGGKAIFSFPVGWVGDKFNIA